MAEYLPTAVRLSFRDHGIREALEAATAGTRRQLCYRIDIKWIFSIGWGTWIRTKINGVRVRCSTVELSPKAWDFSRLRPLEAGRRCRLPCPHLQRATI
jgi:hypothetical protein